MDQQTTLAARIETLPLKNMACHCCIRVVREILEGLNVKILKIRMGEVEVSFDPKLLSRGELLKRLEENGFPVLLDKDQMLVERIRQAVIDMVHHSTFNAMVRNSDFLVEKFDMSYQYLSTAFSKKAGITLEKFIILQKIEKVKTLIAEGELSLSEIAYMMGYSSVQYLSTQFKAVAGVSFTEFKKDPAAHRQTIDELGEWVGQEQ